jgi:hypothetical protein
MENAQTIGYPNYSRNKRIVIIIAVVLLIVDSVLAIILGENSPQSQAINYLTIFAINFLTFAWYHYDILERKQTLRAGWRFLIIFLGIFALIIYLLKTRGFKQGLISIGWYILILLGAIIGSGLAAGITFIIVGEK